MKFTWRNFTDVLNYPLLNFGIILSYSRVWTTAKFPDEAKQPQKKPKGRLCVKENGAWGNDVTLCRDAVNVDLGVAPSCSVHDYCGVCGERRTHQIMAPRDVRSVHVHNSQTRHMLDSRAIKVQFCLNVTESNYNDANGVIGVIGWPFFFSNFCTFSSSWFLVQLLRSETKLYQNSWILSITWPHFTHRF